MKKLEGSGLTLAQVEIGIGVLRRVSADERESQSLRDAARDELVRLERLREKAAKEGA